uniref:Aquaporin n=1 Tax=Tetranychus urticae TaxID=32264 RepID=T1L368_TETUR
MRGHVNPAVTLGMAAIGKLSWLKVPHYFAAQYIGAFFGAMATYFEAITSNFGADLQTEGANATASIFGTFSQSEVSVGTCFLDQYCFHIYRLNKCTHVLTNLRVSIRKNFTRFSHFSCSSCSFCVDLCLNETIGLIVSFS